MLYSEPFKPEILPSLIVTLDTLPSLSLVVTEKPLSLSIDVVVPTSVGIPFASTGAPKLPPLAFTVLAVTLPSLPLIPT